MAQRFFHFTEVEITFLEVSVRVFHMEIARFAAVTLDLRFHFRYAGKAAALRTHHVPLTHQMHQHQRVELAFRDLLCNGAADRL